MLGFSALSSASLAAHAAALVPGDVMRTWVNGEVVTAALMNEHLRDKLTRFKTPFNDDGKLVALSSSYVADLSGSALTGLLRLALDNEISAGKQNFQAGAATRVVIPVGTDKFAGAAGNKTAGSIWVEGDYLHHVSDVKNEWRYLGDVVSTPGGGALPGSVWVDTDDLVHYLDASGVERKLASSSSPHTDAAAVTGSAWVETYLHGISTGGVERQYHNDVAHSDGSEHGDTTHLDTHSDSHTNSHSDTAHSDSHGDSHTDTHSDTHLDEPHEDHDDSPVHEDIGHTDSGYSDHGDVAHDDSHSDTAHSDSHSDSHSDTHSDSHTDHTDHGDAAHTDAPESIGV